MFPVPEHVRQFLSTNYGVSPNSSMFISPNEPQRVYLEHNGTLNFVDFSFPLRGSDASSSTPQQESGGNETDFATGTPKKIAFRGNGGAAPLLGSPGWHSMSDAEREILQKEFRKANAYKTALCQAFKESGFCCYGPACRFAHGEQELRLPPQTHPKYKTQLCNKFALFGRCPYGPRCQFIHQRPSNLYFRRPVPQNLTECVDRGEYFMKTADTKQTVPNLRETEKNSLNELCATFGSMSIASYKPRPENIEFTSSFSAPQLGNALSLWNKPPKIKVEELKAESFSCTSDKSDKKGEDNSSGIESDIAKPWYSAAFENWNFETENGFAQSCFPRFQNTSSWTSGL